MNKNGIMLITYPDSMGSNISEMHTLVNRHFAGAVEQIHILPFFPSSGDRGFAPKTYRVVEPAFGNWQDVRAVAKDYTVMADFMVNHLSAQSEEFKDFTQRHAQSAYKDLFLRFNSFWPGGKPDANELAMVYKRKDRDPYVEVHFADGETEKVWCTFSPEQIDLDIRSDTTWRFIEDSLNAMMDGGTGLVRLDAFAYTIKKRGTNCFFVEPETWRMLERIKKITEARGVPLLPEMHEHYTIQLKLAEKGYWVYDFALPMLVLHTLYTGSGKNLKHWLQICPRNQYTTLDTHDGIGVVDAKDLMSDDELEATVNTLYEKGANVKRSYNSAAYQNLDIYQINCTFYSALGDDDDAYLAARAIQFFAPGIPQVYYVGLLAGANDVELMEQTRFGRNINRHNYTAAEVETEARRPVVQKLLELMRLRNTHPAFGGECIVEDTPDSMLRIRRQNGEHSAVLEMDLKTFRFTLRLS